MAKRGEVMSEFWKLLRESVLIQGIITLLIVSALVYLVCTGQPVPEELKTALLLILGFYFGAKSVVSARESAVAVAQAMRSEQSYK